MKKIEKLVTQDENKVFRLRVLLSKLRAHISLYNQNKDHDLDKMKQLVHEIEFDFDDYHRTQVESDIMANAHDIICDNSEPYECCEDYENNHDVGPWDYE